MNRISILLTLVVLGAFMFGIEGCDRGNQDALIDGIEFIWCPPGTFLMGRNPGELDSRSLEDPQHSVTFAHGFWLSKYEITSAQWEAVMGSARAGCQCNRANSANRPVTEISWNDTQNFLAELNAARPGMNFRLPSEAEWEYACRAGSTTRFFWGDDPTRTDLGNYAWYDQNSGGDAHDVGTRQPNAWGFHDLCGNVWEWVQDNWHSSYSGAPTDGSAWETEGNTLRAVRGGSWYNGEGCRSAFRGGMESNERYGDYGFRIVKAPSAAQK